MKRILSLVLSLIVLLSLISCDSSIRRHEYGNVNDNIYPYLKFTLSADSSYFIATVIDGASLETVTVPGMYQTEFGGMPVKVFAGFENSNDASRLKTLVLDGNIERITENVIVASPELSLIKMIGADSQTSWARLPREYYRKGFHFHGWKAGDSYVSDGMAVESAEARPVFYALVHNEAKNPECTESGNLEYWECPECHLVFTDDEARSSVNRDNIRIEPLGHSFPLAYYPAIEPTCQIEGRIEHWQCDRCGNRFSDADGIAPIEVVSIEKADHVSEERWLFNEEYHYHICKWCGMIMAETKAEHCWTDWQFSTTEEGNARSHECTVCGYSVTELIPDHEHIFDDSDTNRYHEATCLEGAYWIKTCINPGCGKLIKVVDPDNPAAGHSGLHVDFRDSDCQNEGVLEHIECDKCGWNVLNSESAEPMATIIIQKKPHDYSTIWSISDDMHYHLCKTCLIAKADEASHQYLEIADPMYIVSSSTCQHKNTYRKSCICGKTNNETFESGELGEHSYTLYKALDGKEHILVCEYCYSEKPSWKENHDFMHTSDGKECAKCHYKVLDYEGGFDFPIMDPTPLGHIEIHTKEGSEYTFIFVNERLSSSPTTLVWYVDEVVSEETDVTGITDYSSYCFSLDANEPRTYKVMCLFSNDAGARSDTIVIDGSSS